MSVLFEWIWETSLAAAVLIGLVLLLQFALQKFLAPRWRYALWLLVVVRLLMPAVPSGRYSVFNWRKLSLASMASRPSEPRASASGLPLIPVAPPASTRRPEGPPLPLPSQGEEAQFRLKEGPPSRDPRTPGVTLFLAAVPYLWLLGLIGYLLTVLAQHWRLSFWVSSRKPGVSGRVASMIEDAKATLHLRSDVAVIETDSLLVPAVFGFLKPRLLLSKAMLEGLSDEELRLVILHELVHVQRRDLLLNWLLILVQALHWFNPLVWAAFRRLRADRELVCDAAVMRHLSVEERHAYGTTLIKMLDSFSKTPLVPSLVPILNRKHEIHRRIIMIAQFKPTARLVTLASALLLLTLGYFTFTSAAERVSPLAVEKPTAEAALDKQREANNRGLKILEEELARHEEKLNKKQQEVDALKEQLQIADADDVEQRKTTGEAEMPHRLEGLRIEAQSEFSRADSLYNNLSKLSRDNLKRAILTIVPDQLLVDLFSRQAITETKLAELLESFGADHPDVRRTRTSFDNVRRQIDDRLDGILYGLKAKRDAEKARMDSLQTEVEKARRIDMELAIKRRPYNQARRDLDTLQLMRERLAIRILQEKIDAAISK